MVLYAAAVKSQIVSPRRHDTRTTAPDSVHGSSGITSQSRRHLAGMLLPPPRTWTAPLWSWKRRESTNETLLANAPFHDVVRGGFGRVARCYTKLLIGFGEVGAAFTAAPWPSPRRAEELPSISGLRSPNSLRTET